MAAEALQQGAEKLGYEIEVETQGSVGAKISYHLKLLLMRTSSFLRLTLKLIQTVL